MKNKFLVLSMAALFTVPFLFAQQNVIRCWSTEYLASQKAKDVSIERRMEELNRIVKNNKSLQADGTMMGISIPVVVHVIYNESQPQSNIPDAQIHSQIRILNEDFRRMFGTPGYSEDPVSADTYIQFYLATVDPSGNPTTGIIRKATTKGNFNIINDEADDVALKSISYWPSDRYLNMWVANLGGGLLGYAQFPFSGPAETDGVAMGYSAFGDTGFVSAPYNKGRTTTHEVGHYLGLFHIWGDENNCGGSDEVDDTPPCSGEYYSGVATNCVKPLQCGHIRQIENYMDYSDDGCMNIFTHGQAIRMRTVLNQFRSSLFMGKPRLTADLAVANIIYPNPIIVGQQSTIKVVAQNFGTSGQSNYSISYRMNNGEITSISRTSTIASAAFDTVSFTWVPANKSQTVIAAWTTLSGDGNSNNDTLSALLPIIPDRIKPVTEMTAYSDFTLPTSVRIRWKNPTQVSTGAPVPPTWKIVVRRNGTTAGEISSPVTGSYSTFLDTGLVSGNAFSYSIVPIASIDDTGSSATIVSNLVGGSLVPDSIHESSVSGNGSTVLIRVKIPNTHDDQTPFHNLSGIKIFRDNLISTIKNVSVSSTDTGTWYEDFDIHFSATVKNIKYIASALAVNPPKPEGRRTTLNGRVDVGIYADSYAENFETTRRSVTSNTGWDSTNVSAHSGTISFGALNYKANTTSSAYLPVVITKQNPSLSFWTVCRIEALNDSAIVDVTSDFGKTWNRILSMNESTHPEWLNGQNVWKQFSVPLSEFSNDTILIRFRLKSNGTVSGFGWLVDDIVIDTDGMTSVESTNHIPALFHLDQNYPNPFNPTTEIRFTIPSDMHVSLRITDLLGRTVKTLHDSPMGKGSHTVSFDASGFNSGIYFYTLTTPVASSTKKMLLVK